MADGKIIKARNPDTGDEVSFFWKGPNPPTSEDIDRIHQKQLDNRIKMQKVQHDNEPSFFQKLVMSPAADSAVTFAKNFEYHPLDALGDIGSGVKQAVTGSGKEANPRTAGAVRAAKGAMGLVGPPLVTAGMLTAPEVVAPAMAGSNIGSGVANAMVPDDWSPEAKEAAVMAGGFAGGVAGGGLAGRFVGPKVPPPVEVPKPKTGEIMRVAPEEAQGPQFRTGVNYNEPPRFSQQQLPPGTLTPRSDGLPGLGAGPTIQPSSGETIVPPERAPIITPPPVPPLPNESLGNGLPPAPEQGALPGAKPPMQLPRGPIQMGPEAPRQMPTGRAYDPYGTEDERPVTPFAVPAEVTQPKPTPDVVSAQTQAPLSNSEVSSVSTQTPAQVAPVQAPQVPPPQVPAATPPVPQTVQSLPDNPVKPGLAPVPPPTSPTMPIARAPSPPIAPIRPPGGQVAPQTAGPLEAPQSPAKAIVQAPKTEVSRPNLSQKQQLKADADALLKANKPGKVNPPTTTPGPVMSPSDIVAKAMGKLRSAPEQPSAASAEPPRIDTATEASAKKNNQVVEFIKRRQDVTPDHIQNQFGLDRTEATKQLDSLLKRGLATKGKKGYNYIKARGEEIEPEAPSEPPTEVAVKSKRSEKISQLREEAARAEDEGDTAYADTRRHKAKLEEKLDKVEREGTPQQKQMVHEYDELTNKVQALEAKDDAGTLSEDESHELARLYKKVNALEISDFFVSEEGSSPSVKRRPGDNLRRSFLSRWAYSARNVIPPPGFADIRSGAAEMGSPNRVLRDSGIPGAVDIGKGTSMAEVEKYKWLGTTLREDAAALKGLSDEEMTQVARALDVPGSEAGDLQNSQLPPKVKVAAVYLRNSLDKTFAMFPEGAAKGDENVGYLSGYLPHIEKQFGNDSFFTNAVNDALQYHLGLGKGLTDLLTRTPFDTPEVSTPTGKKGSIRNEGIATPRSVFTEHRVDGPDAMQDYSLDLRRIIPMYRKLAAKAIFDKPWIDEAREHLTKIPNEAPKAKAMAEAYLRNYADTPDGYAAIRTGWDNFTNPLMRAHARSLLGLSTRLFSLHGARLLSQIYPEVPTKYFLKGALKAVKDPIGTYVDLGRRGVLPANTVPWFFERPMAKVDRALQAFSTFDFVPDAVGWHGLNEMYLDKGYDPVTAGNMASDKIMDLSMRSTPARMQAMFNIHGPLRPLIQYKQQVLKIAEQYAIQPLDAVKKGEYGRLLRYIVGVGATIAIAKKLGIITFHLSENLINFGGGAYGTILAAIKKGHHDPAGALKDLGLSFGIPASHEVQGLLKGEGLSVKEKSKRTGASGPLKGLEGIKGEPRKRGGGL